MVCPFIDGDDARCARNLKLDRIDFAVAVCADDFAQCPVFWELLTGCLLRYPGMSGSRTSVWLVISA